MKSRFFVLSFVALVGACTSAKNAISPPGQIQSDGSISPCHGHRRDLQACGNAIFNSGRISGLKLGQTLKEVEAVMQHAPDFQTIKASEGKSLQVWGYLVNYQLFITTYVEFTDGVVTGIDSRKTK